jgi:S-adenosylmethionine decarboxylase
LNALGHHLLLELRDCNRAKLDDLGFIQESLLEAAKQAGATVIDYIFHQFSPQGVTGVVAISESHLCIHTWPEHGYAAMDIFTCSEAFDPKAVAQLLIERMESKDPEILEITRGLLIEPVPSSRS